jgi:predicted  nucleic acid-binding Zn-ribbon protein
MTMKKAPNPKGNPASLLDLSKLDKETKRKMSSNGGKKSQAVQREKKLLSSLYAKTIAEMYDVDPDDLEGNKLTFPMVIKAILARGDAASVSMLKEIREATEGSKVALTGPDGGPIQVAKIERVIIDANTIH